MRRAVFSVIFLVLLSILFFLSPLYSQNTQKPIKIGVVSMITPVDTVMYYQEIIDYIAEKINMPVELVY